jgi:superfamily II DNA or RNA helicase
MPYLSRPYQEKARKSNLDAWRRGLRHILNVMPTGTGKTVVAAHTCRDIMGEAGGATFILCHRDELIQQAAAKFKDITGFAADIEKAAQSIHVGPGLWRHSPIVISSVQTMYSGEPGGERMRKFTRDRFNFTVLWVDEGHRYLAPKYKAVVDYLVEAFPGILVLYVTATPDRTDGQSMAKVVQEKVYEYRLTDAIAEGFLVPIKGTSVVLGDLDLSAVNEDEGGDLSARAVEEKMLFEGPLHGVVHAALEVACGFAQGWMQSLLIYDPDARVRQFLLALGDRRPKQTVIFCAGVKQAQRTAEIINRWKPGSADYVAGEQGELGVSMDRRRNVFRSFNQKRIQFLCNCDVLTEGWDEPNVEIVVMGRPTKSRAKYAQMAGRGTRPLEEIAHLLGPDYDANRAAIAASGKTHLLILDFVGVTGKHRLYTSADLIGEGRFGDAVIERTRQRAKAEEIEVEAALAQAQREEDVDTLTEQLRAEAYQEYLDRLQSIEDEEAAKRIAVVATSDYQAREVDVMHGDHDRIGVDASGLANRKGGAELWQLEALEKYGVPRHTSERYTRQQAFTVLRKYRNQRPDDNQLWVMVNRLGYYEDDARRLNYHEAKRVIAQAGPRARQQTVAERQQKRT